jgi:hypothetical protein
MNIACSGRVEQLQQRIKKGTDSSLENPLLSLIRYSPVIIRVLSVFFPISDYP